MNAKSTVDVVRLLVRPLRAKQSYAAGFTLDYRVAETHQSGDEGDKEDKGDKGDKGNKSEMPHAPCPMPNAPCPMPNAQ